MKEIGVGELDVASIIWEDGASALICFFIISYVNLREFLTCPEIFHNPPERRNAGRSPLRNRGTSLIDLNLRAIQNHNPAHLNLGWYRERVVLLHVDITSSDLA